MPSKRSLQENEYYAHPQNAFWRIMGEIFEFDGSAGYRERCDALMREGIAVWDVLAACTRESSLDSDIVASSIMPNDFKRFFDEHSQISAIYFNGAKSEDVYLKHVLPTLTEAQAAVPRLRLPSTSPAHAQLRFDAKLEAWRAVL